MIETEIVRNQLHENVSERGNVDGEGNKVGADQELDNSYELDAISQLHFGRAHTELNCQEFGKLVRILEKQRNIQPKQTAEVVQLGTWNKLRS